MRDADRISANKIANASITALRKRPKHVAAILPVSGWLFAGAQRDDTFVSLASGRAGQLEHQSIIKTSYPQGITQ